MASIEEIITVAKLNILWSGFEGEFLFENKLIK
jgi:hypothetical protein